MIIIDKGENVGNTIKLVSGFILFVIGILIAYEASVYNLIDILLIVGVIIAIVGIILMASYFVDSNADRTTNMIKEFIESREGDSSSFMSNKKSNENEGPLKIRRDYNDYDDEEYGELVFEDYPDEGPSESYLNSQGKDYLGSSLKDNFKRSIIASLLLLIMVNR